MNRIVLDDALGARLRRVERAELFDRNGKRIGRFLSEESFLRLVYDWATAQVTEEELERRRQAPGGKTLAQIWARLGLILMVGIVGLSGCDPVRTIRHNVTIAVRDDHGVPVPDVKVSMKESWESWQTWGGGVPESERSYYHQRWQEEPWLEGATNNQGQAVLWIEITALDWTKGNEPPAKRDFVSNREHIIKLEGQNVQDEIRVVMKPGAVGSGKRYTVTVQAIEKPRYVRRAWKDAHRPTSSGKEKGAPE